MFCGPSLVNRIHLTKGKFQTKMDTKNDTKEAMDPNSENNGAAS